MPYSREEHISYTRNELENYDYYLKVLKHLNNNKINSYIDIGANIGEFCNVLFEKIPSLIDAYLFEVELENFKFMEKHVKNKNVNMFDFGIGYNYKNPTLVNSSNPGGYSVKNNNDETIKSNIVLKTLEELNLPVVDFIKIDIEGGEYNVIENSSYIQNINFLEIEFHNYQNFSVEEYVIKKFPNHKIVIIEDYKGRVLLEKINKNEK